MNEETKKRISDINNGIIPEGYKKTKVGIVPVEWDIKALGKISQFLDNQRKPVKENERSSGIYPYYGASGIIDYVDDYLFDGEYVLLGEDGANIVMRSSPLAFKVKGKMWINNHAHVISPNDNCNIDYLVNILESLNYEKYNSGTAQPKLNREVCESITIPFPPLPEQQKIAEILGAQDKLIELQERKINQLKTLKKGYLQKMFPKKGSKYPELRFKGFTDAWEQRKFGDLGSVAMCKRIFKEQTTDTGEIPFYKIGTFGGEPDAFISRELFEEYKSKFSYPEIGNMLISASGTIGRTVEYTGKDEYFQDSNIVWFKHDNRVDNSFLKCLYSFVKWAGIEGSTIKRLYNDNFLKTEFMLPSVEEQQQIGTYFRNLDHLITLHQRKLDEEKQKKKALMQLLLTGKVRVNL